MKSMILALLALATTPAHAAPDACLLAGDPKAAVTIEEFGDLQCPFCARGANLMTEALRAFPGKVKVVFHNLPLPMHPQSLAAAKAMAGMCRLSPENVSAFQAAVFAHPRELAHEGEAFLLRTAAGLGVSKLKVEMESEEVAQDLARDHELAERHGFNGTPSFMVGKTPVMGAVPFADLKKVIEAEL